MDFSRIRLTGFKSFVDPTELQISKGTTGIVGPNGCGKSNIVEAFKWVMGEASAKRIRGSEMDDVIFNGTDKRPSRNLAEVQLFLNNEDKDSSLHYSELDELVVSRRIEREIGSRYLINGKDVRARDLQLLFADENIGSQSTALVGQGKIGAIINSKPQERRSILEEAAGIKGLHSRKHEAELKLKAAETNLSRVEDVLETLDTQIKSLKRQSRQANRYKNISGHIRKAEALILHLNWVEAKNKLQEAESAFSSLNNKVSSLTADAAEKTKDFEELSEIIPNLRQKATEAAATLQRLSIEKDKLADQEQRDEIDLERNAIRLNELDNEISREEKNLKEYRETRDNLQKEKENIINIKTHEKIKKEEIQNKILDLNTQQQNAENQLQKISQEITSVINEQLSEKVSFARNEALKASEERTKAFAARQKARDDLAKIESRVTALDAEVNTLSEFLNINEDDLWPKLIDSVSVVPGYEKALGAALGDDLNAATDEGATAFWLKMPIYEMRTSLPDGVEPLENYVDGPDILKRRLSQIGLVNSLDGNSYIHKLKQGQRIVNKDGFMWRWDGFVSSDKSKISSADRLNQLNKLKKLKSELFNYQEELKEKESFFTETEKLTHSAHLNEEKAQNNVGLIIDQIEKNREVINLYQSEFLEGKTDLNNLKQLLNEKIDKTNLVVGMNKETNINNNDENKENSSLGNLQLVLKNSKETIRNLENEQIKMDHELKSNEVRINQIEVDFVSLNKKISDVNNYLTELNEKKHTITGEIQELQTKPQIISNVRQQLLNNIEDAKKIKDETSDALLSAETKLSQADKISKEAQMQLSSSREERVREQSAVELATQNTVSIERAIEEKLECKPYEAFKKSEYHENKQLPSPEEIENKILRLKNERERMGPVNLRADIESEETLEQLNLLNDEKEDLNGAIYKLRRGISDLNREGRVKMIQSFESVDKYFKEFFKTLFNGGKAHLKLVDSDDPLEAGLEIMVCPPGKKLQSMSLLSGGEQALTALALLFAVFKTNPAPICVLDEVDAPLDDTNVHRFCDLIEKIINSLKTRFLIITHNTITMSRMDKLYGVTMEEKGVSQLVSVDLEDASNMKEAI